jgi:ADP-ribose pyrophosphatase YjhB (NUDIX family)
MTSINPPRWLQWAREIQALAQTGCHYAASEYDRERYRRLMEIAAEITADHTEIGYEAIRDCFRAQVGYATPRIDVRGAVFRDGKLLLVKERLDGGWTMPGGWADVGDTPAESVEREVLEEAGLRARAHKVIGVYDANRMGPLELFHAFKIVFLCDLIAGEPSPGVETSEVAFFGPSEIPMQFSGERTSLRHIQDAFAVLADPNRPTQFD